MHITKEDILDWFEMEDYNRGLQYMLQGRVLDMEQTWEKDIETIRCQVLGNELYHVSIYEMDQDILDASCSCPRFEREGSCKHIAAAMLQLVWKPMNKKQSGSDWYARKILQRYADMGLRPEEPAVPARLVPSVTSGWGNPIITFRVGTDYLYTVKNIRQFLRDVQAGNTVVLGKKCTLNHSITSFDAFSRELIRILMGEVEEFQIGRHAVRCGDSKSAIVGTGASVRLTGSTFDRFFELVEAAGETAVEGNPRFCREDPQVVVTFSRNADAAVLAVELPDSGGFFGDYGQLYAWDASRVMRCSDGFREKVYPLLRESRSQMTLSLGDLPEFCSCVLPEIEGYVTLNDPTGLLEEYLPEDCTPCFYFDMEDEILSLQIKFRYGEMEYPELPAREESLRRDCRAERRASAFAGRYFALEDGAYVLAGEVPVYDFLTGTLERFRSLGEVYVSERLRRKQIPPARAAVGLSVSDGMLTLDLDTGEFPAGELEALYQSLLKKKKYHRLADGRFLTLDGSSYEKLAEMAHMLQLSPKELSMGELKVPAFRALYLDSVLAGSEELDITRDKQVRGMIRSFQSLSDSDHRVPEHLEDVLRPYQKTGFRWLKTLADCGFGGILADEMGLGKTAQVIAYLTTLDRAQTKHPSIVVCPASLILNWGEEFAKFAPMLNISLIYGTAAERKRLIEEDASRDVWVTSYELLRQDIKLYQELAFHTCILDEGQHIKNQSTLVSRAVKAVNCCQRFVLTGTPIENRLSELWNLFDFLMPGYLFSHRVFVEKLEKPIVKSKNPDAMAQLRKLVQPFLLRREKKEVLKELPPKIEYIRRIAMGEKERRTYLSTVNAAKNTLTDTGKLKILGALTQLRQVCCDPNLCFENYDGETSKLDACLELCAGMAANGHQILLFSQFTSMLDILRAKLEGMGLSTFTLQGSTPKEQRAKLVKDFNAGGASVFLISLKAGGTGLNLTAADVVIHYDPWWNLAAQNQATDRAHRIGQRQCVQVYKLIAKDTIEERILDLQERKAELLDVISGESGSILEMSREELLALLD